MILKKAGTSPASSISLIKESYSSISSSASTSLMRLESIPESIVVSSTDVSSIFCWLSRVPVLGVVVSVAVSDSIAVDVPAPVPVADASSILCCSVVVVVVDDDVPDPIDPGVVVVDGVVVVPDPIEGDVAEDELEELVGVVAIAAALTASTTEANNNFFIITPLQINTGIFPVHMQED